ncbi:hypothetical protein HD806DRAFT_499230 [Xylariaceae sp. AK1471]|nr:hypothetical protein HD806DRAFT_499230 [Xylariaceae sp. AK1471]
MITLQDGKVAKLRAACDNCNESKVRCSQTKPQCGRCARQGVSCVYGLSRRSHKTAPRIGALATTAPGRFVASHIDPSLLLESSDIPSGSNSTSGSGTTAFTLSTSSAGDGSSLNEVTLEDRSDSMDDADAAHARALVPSTIDSMSGFDTYIRLLAESGGFDLSTCFGPESNLGSDTAMGTSDFVSQYLPPAGSSPAYAEYSGSQDSPPCPQKRPSSISCNCTTLAVKELLSMPFQSEEEAGFCDITFSRLKQAIRISEECISCTCTTRDEMSIITTSTLIGRIIEGFEIPMEKTSSLTKINGLSTADSAEDSPHGSAMPTLSWGVLQIEPDEEAELKHHMWFIQFKKLQRVIKKLGMAVTLLRNAQDSGNSAHIVTCQSIHMWLMQKAEVLQHRYLNTDGAAVAKESSARRRSVCSE